jgi:hypothetical protein
MAFPAGANINEYKRAFFAKQKKSSSFSDEDELSCKVLLYAKKAKGTNKTLFRFDRDIAQFEAKQQKLMVEFHDIEEKVKILRQQRQKALNRIEEDNWDEIAKARRKVGLPVTMIHREAIEPPMNNKEEVLGK